MNRQRASCPFGMTKVLTLAALAAATVLAGCLGSGDEASVPLGAGTLPFDPEWALHAVLSGDDHDHRDAAHHQNLSTPNFEVLGWDPLLTDLLGTSASGMFCGGVAEREDGRRLAVVNGFFSEFAFLLVDVTDPAAPAKVGEFFMDHAHAYDVDITPDGMHVIVGTDSGGTSQGELVPPLADQDGVTVRFRDACGRETLLTQTPLPLKSGLVMVGVADPSNPVIEDYKPLPVFGAHSVSTAEVDGTTFVLGSTVNLVHQASYFEFLEVADLPGGSRLVPLSVYQAPPPTSGDVPLVNGHVDGSIQKHPIDGKTYAYLADWDRGVVVVDVTNPRTPTYVASFSDFGGGLGFLADGVSGSIHETLPIEGTWDGKHYVFAGQEIVAKPGDRPSGWVHVLDTTDPAKMTWVGAWTLPVDADWFSTYVGEDKSEYVMYSTHYIELVERTLFVTLYHGGVWAVDVSNESLLANPPSIGAFLPANVSPAPGGPAPAGEPLDYTPCVLDVLGMSDGSLVVFDAMSGVYTVHFDASKPAPSPPPWSRS